MMRIVALLGLIVALSACSLPSWWPESLGGRERRDRLVEGPLRDTLIPPALLPPLATLGPDGMRLTIAPSFGDFAYAIDFVPQPLGCYFHPGLDFDQERTAREGCRIVETRYVILRVGEGFPAVNRRFRFRVPEEEFREAVREFNRLARSWGGGDMPGLDGTSIGVEQAQERHLRSMRTNSSFGPSPDNPAMRLLPHVHRMLLAYGPTGAVPISDSFAVGEARAFPCIASSFNTPDPDGFGVGDDACARSLAAPPASGR